jgi:hypothetical protein
MRCSTVKVDLMGRQQHRHTTVQRDTMKAAGTLVWQVLPIAVDLLLLLLLPLLLPSTLLLS